MQRVVRARDRGAEVAQVVRCSARIWPGVSAAPRLSESSCMLAPRRFTSRPFSWMRPRRLTRRLRMPVWTRVALDHRARSRSRSCRLRRVEGRAARGSTGADCGSARRARKRRSPRPGTRWRAEAQRPCRRSVPAIARRGARGVDVARRVTSHVDRGGAGAAAQARAGRPPARSRSCRRAAGRPRAGCRCSSTSRPRTRPTARCDSGGMSNFWRRLSTRTTRRLTPLRRDALGAQLERQVGADVQAERLAVQPHRGAVVDRLEAQHPLGCRGRARAARKSLRYQWTLPM